jgi:predicted nuclease of restriction endonuclease-like (RecB) superfamily
MKSKAVLPGDYEAFLVDLKDRVRNARISVGRTVNREMILLYWDIGQAIVEKQRDHGWGDAVVETLSKDLRTEFHGVTGFSVQNLWRMRQFYLDYTSPAFLSQVVRDLPSAKDSSVREVDPSQAVRDLLSAIPWGHFANVLNRDMDPAARLYYLRATAQFGWSRSVLLNQIKAGAYERSQAEGKSHNFPAALPELLAEQAEEALKSSYNLEFLGIGQAVKERELEDRLIERVQQFILELGYGFCFIGRQYRLTLGRKEYFIDLLFYHRFLKALVAVELKVGAFEPEYAGKMDFYLNLLNEKERGTGDNPSIGIILCAEKDNLEVEFALKSKLNPIGVAEYHLQTKLPPEFKGKLPTPKQLTEIVRSVLPVGGATRVNETEA